MIDGHRTSSDAVKGLDGAKIQSIDVVKHSDRGGADTVYIHMK
jgi:hypothetical protein